jgi:hypothetical protein
MVDALDRWHGNKHYEATARFSNISGMLNSSVGLLQFRQRLERDHPNALNTNFISYNEIYLNSKTAPHHGYTGLVVADDALAAASVVSHHDIEFVFGAVGWTLALDPLDVGVEQLWWQRKVPTNATANFSKAVVAEPLELSAAAKSWARTHQDRAYEGVYWYRMVVLPFDPHILQENRSLVLAGVTNASSVCVWANGVKLGGCGGSKGEAGETSCSNDAPICVHKCQHTSPSPRTTTSHLQCE